MDRAWSVPRFVQASLSMTTLTAREARKGLSERLQRANERHEIYQVRHRSRSGVCHQVAVADDQLRFALYDVPAARVTPCVEAITGFRRQL